MRWWWQRRPEPDALGDLTLWEDSDGALLWAERGTDPAAAAEMAAVKEVLREQGWHQIAGD